jgi:phage terminase small subunit
MRFKIVGAENLIAPEVFQGEQKMNPLDNFKWTSGANVQAIWRKYGWTPPSEHRNDYLFKQNRDAIET